MQVLGWVAAISIFWLFGGFENSWSTDKWFYKYCSDKFDKSGVCGGETTYGYIRWKANENTRSVVYQFKNGPPMSIKNCDIIDNQNWSCENKVTYYCFNSGCNFGIDYARNDESTQEVPGFYYRFAIAKNFLSSLL